MTGPSFLRTAAALGAMAAAAVLAAGTAVVVDAVAPDSSHDRAPAVLVVAGGGLRLALPQPDWRATPPSTTLSYRLPGGGRVALRGAALLRPGACPGDPDSTRGFLGLTRGRHAALVDRWRRGVAGRHGSVVRAAEVRAPRVVRTDVVLRLPADAPCAAPAAVLTVVTVRGGDGGGFADAMSVVAVRDAEVPDALSDAAFEEVLQTLRSRT